MRTPSSSNGELPMAPGMCGFSDTSMWSAKIGLPSASTRKVALRYSAPPLAAWVKAPSRPSASGASNSTGNLPVRRRRADRRDSVRSAA
ncbi:Uncharacterised protein [Bordetella pertussis]|nr:Uncharacterised protein [Bordetella pertussis]